MAYIFNFRYSRSTSTNGLWSHLQTFHNHNIEFIKQNDIAKQRKINEMFVQKPNQNTQKSEKENKFLLSRQIATMCALDFLPFSIVEKRGFSKFCNWQNIKNLPTARTISDSALTDVYFHVLSKIKEEIDISPRFVTVALDNWTDSYKRRAFITMQLHYCKNDFELFHCTLKTEAFPHPHNKVRIKSKINEVIKQFGLEHKEIIAVSDNGRNIVAGCNITESVKKHFSCAAHNLHLFLTKNLLEDPQFTPLSTCLEKLRRIYRKLMYKHQELEEWTKSQNVIICANFLKNVIEVQELIEIDEQFILGDEIKKHKTLKLSVVTRWNSILTMVKSFNESHQSVNLALGHLDQADLIIGAEERRMLIELEHFLEIFENCTKVLQGSTYPTLSLYIIFYESMMKRYVSILPFFK